MQVVMSGSDLCGNMYNKQVLDIQFTNFIYDSKIWTIKWWDSKPFLTFQAEKQYSEW